MNVRIKRTVLTMGLICATLSVGATNPIKPKTSKPMMQNPLMQPSNLPFGAPDFRKIKDKDFLPAIKAGIAEQKAAIARIVNNKEKPTFANTILAYEKSGLLLDRVSSIFFALVGANKSSEIEAAEKQVIPMLTELENEIKFNKKFFTRIKYVYDNELKNLKGEDKKLTEEIYNNFVKAGALLPQEKMDRMQAINKSIATLQQEFATLLPKAGNASAVWVNNVEQLSGLSKSDIAQCQKDAQSRGGKAPYCIVITNTTQHPLLASLDNRELRKQLFEASLHRADGTGEYNTFPIIVELAKLRAEKAEIMGYKNFANYSLSTTMAKNTDNTDAFLNGLIEAYLPKIDAETKEIEAYARRTQGADFKLQPYDRFYYSAKMKKEEFNFSADEVKPYFDIDSVLVNGVLYAASKVYGLSFKKRTDIPTYHKDMQVFEITDVNGKPLSLFYVDYFRRPSKRGGAWMSSFAKQSSLRNQLPVIYNVCNYAKAPDGEPTLVTWDEVTTMFHEFGHALHGILSNCKYNTLSATAVSRDFVEMPSQFNEYFASVPEIFNNYAKHYKTNAPMPDDLKEKMLKSLNYHAAYALGENLAATMTDLAWHKLDAKHIPSATEAQAFQNQVLKDAKLLNEQVPPRYSTSYFNHVWGGGYAAGYYSYLWSEVLAVNVADYFEKNGAINRNVGDAFRSKILSIGNTKDLLSAFSSFTGLKAPDAAGLLKSRGL